MSIELRYPESSLPLVYHMDIAYKCTVLHTYIDHIVLSVRLSGKQLHTSANAHSAHYLLQANVLTLTRKILDLLLDLLLEKY